MNRGTSRPGGDSSARLRLTRALESAGLPTDGSFTRQAGWVSQAWVGADVVVRIGSERFRAAYEHEARVVELLAGTDVPHAPVIAHGEGPDGPWSISERIPGQTLHRAWVEAAPHTRRTIIASLGEALRALHCVCAPAGMLPPWLDDALGGGAWPAYHPPVVRAAVDQARAAQGRPDRDRSLLAEVADWIEARGPLFESSASSLVHGDIHGSNVMVDQGRVVGLIDFAEASTQPADVELDTILRWCARPVEFPPTPDSAGLRDSEVADIPGWLRESYPELFEHPELRERLAFYDVEVELAIYAHHPHPEVRAIARDRLVGHLEGHSHLDDLTW